MMYMIPIRRASACGWPVSSGARTSSSRAVARAASAGSVASRSQSKARDSLCSLVLDPVHERLIVP